MLTPRQLDNIPDSFVELYSQVEADIIADMARRIAKMDFIPSAEWQYKKLVEMGATHDYILKRLSAASGISKKELKKLMHEAGVKTVESDSKIYKKAGLAPTPLDASPSLQAVLAAGIGNTNGLFENFTQTTANTATKQFENALDRAWLQINTGAFDRNSAIRMAVKSLASKGIASITYPSGHTDYMDVAVRRAVVTGVNQTSLKLQDALADELGCDLVETSAHSGARPSHAEWQGKVFSRSGKHKKYPPFRESTGYGTGAGLGGWNCSHSYNPFFEGMQPVYTQAELEDMNAKKYEYNGVKMTEYEATQKQRSIERKIRKWKREYAGMDAAGLPTDKAASKLSYWQRTQKDFIKQTGLKRQYNRESIPKVTKQAANVAPNNTGKKLTFNPEADFSIKIDGLSDKQLNGISNASREVAELGAADNKEHLILVDNETGNAVYKETGDNDSVGGTKFWSFLRENRDKSFSFVHNHNTDGILSETDLSTLLRTENLDVMIATRLDGVKYVAPKDKTAPKPSGLWDLEFQNELKELNDLSRSGRITAGERTRMREEIIVEQIIKRYVKGFVELDGRK